MDAEDAAKSTPSTEVSRDTSGKFKSKAEPPAEPLEAGAETADEEVVPESPDGEPETTEAETPDETPEPDEDSAVETFEQFAKTIGHEPEALLAQLKVPGPSGNLVPLSEVVANYRTAAEAGNLRDQLEQKYSEFNAKIQEFDQTKDVELARIQQLTARLLPMVEADRKIDWEKLKQEDPAQYSVMKLEAQERHEAVKAGIDAQIAERDRQSQTMNAQREQWKADEAKKLATKRPDIAGTPELRRAFATEALQSLAAAGFQPHEIADFIPDHRVLEYVYDALAYRKLKAKGPLTLKALKAVPKILPPQVRGVPKDPKAESMKRLRLEQKKRGDLESTAALFLGEMQ